MATDKEFQTAVLAYAQYLGVDLDHEPELIQIARDALEDLPNGWEVCISEEGDSANIPFFHNSYTEESVWHHPQEDVYLRKVKEERKYLKGKNYDKDMPRKYDHDREKSHGREMERLGDRSGNISKEKNRDDNIQAIDVIDVEDFEEEYEKNGRGRERSQSQEKDKSRSGRGSSLDREHDRRRGASPIFGTNWLPDSLDAGDKVQPHMKGSEGNNTTTDRDGNGHGRKSEWAGENSSAGRVGGGSRWDRDTSGGTDSERREGQRGAGQSGSVVGDRVKADQERKYGNKENVGTTGHYSGGVGGSTWGGSPTLQQKEYGYTNTRHTDSTSGGSHPIKSDMPHQQQSLWINTSAEASKDENYGRPWTSGHMNASAGSMPESGGRLQLEIRRLQDEVSALRSTHKMEVHEMELVIQSLRSSLQTCESSLQSERSMKRASEEALRDAQREMEVLRMERQSSSSFTGAEEAKRAEIERVSSRLNDEWQDKLRVLTNSHQAALETELETSRGLRQRLVQEEDKVRAANRQIAVVKEEMQILADRSTEGLKSEIVDLEGKLRVQTLEMTRVKEEYASMAARAAAALQQTQAAKAEVDALRAETTAVMADGHTSHAALMQAMQRISQYETEIVRINAEKAAMQHELDSQFATIRTFQESNLSKDGKVQLSDMELKRAKTQLQAEISRLKSRLAEVEAANTVLTDQFDRSLSSHLSETKDLQRALDRSEHEASRLQDRVQEGDERIRELQTKCANLEREILGLQDSLFKKERIIKDLNGKLDVLCGQREELRASLEDEIQITKDELSAEKLRYADLVQTHRKELSDLQREVEKKIPLLAADITAQAEAHFSEQLLLEVSTTQAKFQRQVEALKKEIFDIQASHSESMGRAKAGSSEDKIELERLRQKCHLLEARHGDMEAMIESLRIKERQQLIQWGDTGRTSHVSTKDNVQKGAAKPLPRVAYDRPPDSSSIEDDSVTLDRFIDGETMNSITDELAEMRKQLTETLHATKHAATQSRVVDSRGDRVELTSDSSVGVGRPSITSRSQRHHRSPSSRSASKPSRKHTSVSSGNHATSARNEMSQEFPITRTPNRQTVKPSYSPEALFKSPEVVRHHNTAAYPAGGGATERHSHSMISDIYDTSFLRPESSVLSDSLLRPNYEGRYIPGDKKTILNSDVEEFAAVHDGGYHEGYWKAKYLRGLSRPVDA